MYSQKYIYDGTVTSNGVQTTTNSDQVVDFGTDYKASIPSSGGTFNTPTPTGYVINAGYVKVSNEGTTTMTIKINDEPFTHSIAASSYEEFKGVKITKFTVVESGSKYSYVSYY